MAKPNATANELEKVDGRKTTRERNRNAVVDALLGLYGDGNLSPSAEEVAERSGVSRRSLFRYFDDLDDLCRAAIERQTMRASLLIELKDIGKGTLPDRIERLAAQRSALFEAIAPSARVGRLRAPFQPLLAELLRKSRALLGRQVERHFEPELSGLDPQRRRVTLAAADVLCSFEAFDLLRRSKGLSPVQYEATLQLALKAIVEAANSAA